MTPWTVDHQAPVFIRFPRQDTGVGCHSLLQGIFLTQGLNLGLPHFRQTLYYLSYHETPKKHHGSQEKHQILDRVSAAETGALRARALNYKGRGFGGEFSLRVHKHDFEYEEGKHVWN